jgi:5'/3'-nucleotidase
MRILVTNDDGINAPGLMCLEEIAEKLSDDVWVVAPETNQSGASHSLTLHEPLRCNEVSERRFAVRGTPTDCVIMGVRHILKDNPPDLVLSGVNFGSNIAEDVTYSGTIAGAIEGALLGIRSMAFSLAVGFDQEGDVHWETPLAFGPMIVKRLLEADLPDGILVNINFPDLAPEAVAGISVARQGRRDQNNLHVDARHDTWGNPYYWFGFERRKSNPDEGTDLWAIYKGLISVTPLHVDLTNEAMFGSLKGVFADTRRPIHEQND